LYAFRVWFIEDKCDFWGSTTVINVILLKKGIDKILDFYKSDRMIAMWPKWWKKKPKMRKFNDTLLFIVDGKIWGIHLVGHPDKRKGWSGEPFY
jgi:hypothetical protein